MAFTIGSGTFTNGSATVTNVSLTSGTLAYFASGTRMVVGTNPVVQEVEAIAAPTVTTITLRNPWSGTGGTYSFLANQTSEGLRDAVQSIRTANSNLQSFIDSISVTATADSVVKRDALGNIETADKIIHSGDTNTAVRFPAADTVTVETAGSERVRVDSAGNVGIGTSSPGNRLVVGHESHGVAVDYLGSSALPSIAGIFTDNGANGGQGFGSLQIKTRSDFSGYSINFFTTAVNGSPTERMRIDSSGKLLSPNGSAFVGTVSNSGNGAIIERGSNANGEYVKYADGTMICWAPFSNGAPSVSTINTASGALYKAETLWTFPVAFVGLLPVLSSGVGAADHISNISPASLTSADIRVFSTSAQTAQRYIYCLAIGRWY